MDATSRKTHTSVWEQKQMDVGLDVDHDELLIHDVDHDELIRIVADRERHSAVDAPSSVRVFKGFCMKASRILFFDLFVILTASRTIALDLF